MENSSSPSPRQSRQAAGWSLEKAAVTAGVSIHSARLYEASPAAVTDKNRAKLDRVYADLAALAAPAPKVA